MKSKSNLHVTTSLLTAYKPLNLVNADDIFYKQSINYFMKEISII